LSNTAVAVDVTTAPPAAVDAVVAADRLNHTDVEPNAPCKVNDLFFVVPVNVYAADATAIPTPNRAT